MNELLRLRDIPDIQKIETALSGLSRLMADERFDLWRLIDQTSLRLFGITERDTGYTALPSTARPATQEEWERHFEFLDYEYEEENAFWTAFDLDVSDGEGNELLSIGPFGRQLVCALKRLHPSSALLFASGEMHQDQHQAAAEAWARRLFGKGSPNEPTA